MVISICGDDKYKNILINKFKDIYKDKLGIYNYSNIKFKSIIDTEKYKYELLESSISLESARLKYSKIVDNTVKNRLDKLLDDNKDKIIILTNDSVLSKDFYFNKYFLESDIKVLVSCENIDDINYNKELFDYVFSNVYDIDVKRLVKE